MTRAAEVRDREWIADVLCERWGEARIVSRGRVHDARQLPAVAAERDQGVCGLATYLMERDECELITLDALMQRSGVGTVLLAAVEQVARRSGCTRMVLVTSNDNLAALRFYQARGYRIVAVHANAITRARAIKPSIPMIGSDGIPIGDEIELEKRFDAG